MIDEFMGKCKSVMKEILCNLKGREKRKTVANIVKEYGYGGQSYVSKEFNVSRDTIRKGMYEMKSGIGCADGYNMRGRKPITEKLPNILKDIQEIADMHSQIDPKFKSERLYMRLTVSSLRSNLIKKKDIKMMNYLQIKH